MPGANRRKGPYYNGVGEQTLADISDLGNEMSLTKDWQLPEKLKYQPASLITNHQEQQWGENGTSIWEPSKGRIGMVEGSGNWEKS